MNEKTEYEECVKHIKSRFGDELTSLCDIKEEDIHIEKDLVVGWLLTRDASIPDGIYFNLYPMLYVRGDYEGRDESHNIVLGYTLLSFDPCALGHISSNDVLKEEKIVKILPAQPNTYYITYFVDTKIIGCVAFAIGVMHNPDTKEIIKIAKEKYYLWLKSYEFEQLIDRLKAKSKSKNNS
jgi:hypothetical protein